MMVLIYIETEGIYNTLLSETIINGLKLLFIINQAAVGWEKVITEGGRGREGSQEETPKWGGASALLAPLTPYFGTNLSGNVNPRN